MIIRENKSFFFFCMFSKIYHFILPLCCTTRAIFRGYRSDLIITSSAEIKRTINNERMKNNKINKGEKNWSWQFSLLFCCCCCYSCQAAPMKIFHLHILSNILKESKRRWTTMNMENTQRIFKCQNLAYRFSEGIHVYLFIFVFVL